MFTDTLECLNVLSVRSCSGNAHSTQYRAIFLETFSNVCLKHVLKVMQILDFSMRKKICFHKSPQERSIGERPVFVGATNLVTVFSTAESVPCVFIVKVKQSHYWPGVAQSFPRG